MEIIDQTGLDETHRILQGPRGLIQSEGLSGVLPNFDHAIEIVAMDGLFHELQVEFLCRVYDLDRPVRAVSLVHVHAELCLVADRLRG